MKRAAISVFVCVFLICIYSCNVKNSLLSHLWFYTHSSSHNNRDSLLTPVNFLYLHKDGTYTSDLGVFKYGHWHLNNDQLMLTDSKNQNEILNIKNIGTNELELIGSNGTVSDFEKQPESFDSQSDDPFSIENNRWRLHAIHSESEAEIKERLRNHCRFWEAYFNWALKNEMQYLDVRSTPTLIKVYGNGFMLKPVENLPAVWRSYFFDAEDCERANAIIKSVFERGNISWAHTDNKYKMFISAFQQLQQQLQ